MNRRLFRKLFPTFVISLERTPHRLARFLEWNKDADIDVEVAAAVDGKTLDLANLDPALIAPGTTAYRPGSIGSAMSHKALWERCAAGNKPFFILEDDAAVRGDIKTILPPLVDGLDKSWELLIVGYNTDVFTEIAVVGDMSLRAIFSIAYPDASQLVQFTKGRQHVGVGRLISFFGLCGYLISPTGARSLLRQCFPLDSRTAYVPVAQKSIRTFTLDTRVNAHLRFIQAYACLPPLVMPDNAPTSSVKA
jgi:glycosyl transferase, family 25